MVGGQKLQRAFGRARLVALGVFLVATATAAVGTAGQTPALAATYADPDFYDETYVSGLSGPVQLEWLPGGRLLVAEQSGVVRMVENGSVLPTPFVDISDQVNGIRDRGLLGIAAHPDFPVQPYVYLLFTYDPPETAGQTGRAGPDGKGARVSRLIRLTAESSTGYATADPGSELILMGTNSTAANIGNLGAPMNDFGQTTCDTGGIPVRDCLPADGESHTIGSVRFGADGYLYISNGDAASYTQADARALRSLDLDSMAGKVFRIDPVTGQGPSDNPYFDGNPASNRSKVWISGLRNPFRFTLDPFDGDPWIGDVGWGTWEEINHGSRGADFGWPCYEGGSGNSIRQPSYEPSCGGYYATDNATPADYAWYRGGQGGSAIAGVVYTGFKYPSEYRNALFFGDYAQGWIKYSPTDGAGNLLTNGGDPIVSTFATGVGPFVDFSQGPDGSLYYIDIISGSVRRIVYAGVVAGPQLRYSYYEGTWAALPDFGSLIPQTTGTSLTFDVGLREREDNFALHFAGCLDVPTTGAYTFSTTSDDGSQLLVDSGLVVDNDGLHGPVTATGTATLDAGLHPLSVTFFDQGGGQELSARWSGPGFSNLDIAPDSVVTCDAQLAASPAELGFGEVEQGTAASQSITIQNTSGPAPLEVISVTTGDAAVFSATAPLPVSLQPGESISFDVSFTPQDVGPASGSLQIAHSGTNDPKTVALSGIGVAPQNTNPTIEIVSPLDGAFYDLGSTVPLQANAPDAEDGSAAVSWTGILHHGTDHVHPNEFNATGATASFVLNDHDDNAWIEVCATATDSQNATATQCVNVYPTLVEYTFDSVPSGLEITYHAQSQTTPFTVATPVGAIRTIAAPTAQGTYDFVGWSIGGPAAQAITIGDEPATIVATYQPPQIDPPQVTNPGDQANRVGDAVELPIAGQDPDGGTVTYAATGLPPGLSQDGNTGEITGTPTTVGSYTVMIEVTDEESDTADATFEWTIKPQLAEPLDIANSIYRADIMWLLDEEITRGCNPPANDRYCPGGLVTRGQMAAFLVRFLGLTDSGAGNAFGDDDGSIFEKDIDKLAAAGITAGCDGTGDRFCPLDLITRGQMAALLVRALGLEDAGTGNLFTDDDDSVFENDIDKLATAGITRGCNPPDNTHFCPADYVTRGQMAAFLRRAWNATNP